MPKARLFRSTAQNVFCVKFSYLINIVGCCFNVLITQKSIRPNSTAENTPVDTKCTCFDKCRVADLIFFDTWEAHRCFCAEPQKTKNALSEATRAFFE